MYFHARSRKIVQMICQKGIVYLDTLLSVLQPGLLPLDSPCPGCAAICQLGEYDVGEESLSYIKEARCIRRDYTEVYPLCLYFGVRAFAVPKV